mgnify:CR=1 FL=1
MQAGLRVDHYARFGATTVDPVQPGVKHPGGTEAGPAKLRAPSVVDLAILRPDTANPAVLAPAPPPTLGERVRSIADGGIATALDGCGGIGIAEDVDHVDLPGLGFRNVGDMGIDPLAVQGLALEARIDRDDPVAEALQKAHHAIAWPLRLRAGADQGDDLGFLQDAAQG